MNECAFCPWILPALAVLAALGIAFWFWRSRRDRLARINSCEEWCPLSESEYCPEDKAGCPLKCSGIADDMKRRHGKEDDTRRAGA